MTQVAFKGSPVQLTGNFPQVGSSMPKFTLTTNNMQEVSSDQFKSGILVLNIFPSLDTPVCADSVIKFNKEVANFPNTTVLCISKDLPFAQARFCATESIHNAQILSAFRHNEFAQAFGIDITDSALKGLLARSIIVLDAERKVVYTQLVPEISEKPNYNECLEALKKLV